MSRKVKANGKIFTFNDNVTDEQISKAVDEYFKGDIKKKEPSQELPSQKVQTTQAQPIQPKSSGTGSFMGGAEGAYQESKKLATKQPESLSKTLDLQEASKEAFNIYKNSPLISSTVKESLGDENAKSIINRRLGLEVDLSNPSLEGAKSDLIFSLNKGKRDRDLKSISIEDLSKVSQEGLLIQGDYFAQVKLVKYMTM